MNMDRSGLDARCPPKSLYYSSPWGGEENDDKRLVGQEKGREKSLSNYCHGQKMLNLRK